MGLKKHENGPLQKGDYVSNTKTIKIQDFLRPGSSGDLLRPRPSGDLVVKSKLSPRSSSVALRESNPIYEKGP